MIELIKGNANYSIENKIIHLLDDIKKYIYKKIITLDNWEIRQGKYIDFGNYEFKNQWHNLSIGDYWATSGETAFIRKTITVNDAENEYIGLLLDTDGEGLLYVNNEPFHGVDNFRGYICLCPKAKKEETFNLLIEHKAGGYEDFEDKPEKHIFKDAKLLIIDKETESIYYDYLVPFDTASNLKDEFLKKLLLNTIYENLLSINWLSKDIKNEFINKNKEFKEKLKQLPKAPGQVHFIGNSHIDLVFMWPERETHRKVGRTFNSLLRLMEEFPHYYFMCSQVPIYEYLKKYYPNTYTKIKELIKEGRFEPIGGTYVQHSTNLLSGESLVRQCLYGKRYFQKEFNYNVEIGWLPDTFGFAYSLPQIYKQAGIKTLFTQKLRYNDTNSHIEPNNFPELMFNWEGIDGTKILMYNTGSYKHLTTDSMDFMLYNMSYYYNKVKDLPIPEYIAPYGFGDGGGGVNRKELEYIKRLNTTPGFPKVKAGTAKEFFDNLPKKDLTNYNNELYLESHRGTYTSQGKIKKLHRQSEIALRNCEILGLLGNNYQKEKLNNLWKKLLFNQFHDILPGSSVREGVTDAENALNNILNETQNINKKSLEIFKGSHNIFVFNPLSFKIKSLIEINSEKNWTIKDKNNNIIPSDFNNNTISFTDEIEGFSGKVYYISEEKREENIPFSFSNNILESPYYNITFSEKGYICQIFDKEQDRNVLSDQSNIFQSFYDKPVHFDAWDIDPKFETHKEEWICSQKPKLIFSSSVKCILETEYKYNKSTIKQNIIIYNDLKKIDFKTFIDWHEDHILLKTAFYPDVKSNEASYEIPYGTIKRPTTRNNSSEKAKFEVCGQRWADISEPNYGVSILNDCKYGWDIKDNQMRLTLLKSPKWPDKICDMGEHEFTYSLFPHTTCLLNNTIKESHNLNNPFISLWSDRNEDLLPFISVKDNVIIDCIKKAEDTDHIIVRLYEAFGNRGKSYLKFNKNIQEIKETNILEEEIKNVELSNNKAEFYIKPFEIKTFKIKI